MLAAGGVDPGDSNLLTGPEGAHGGRQLVDRVDRTAADGDDHVTFGDAGVTGGRTRLDAVDGHAGAGVTDLDSEDRPRPDVHLVAAVAGRDVVRDRQGIVDRDREADARRAHLEVAVDGGGGVHADHLAVGVDERPTGIARFDRRVDLNEAVQRLEAAAGIAAGGDGLVETGHTSRAGRRR